MADERDQKPSVQPPPRPDGRREARLAAALRDNLRRRKAQARNRRLADTDGEHKD